MPESGKIPSRPAPVVAGVLHQEHEVPGAGPPPLPKVSKPHQPPHDHLSYIDACQCKRWHLALWPKADPSKIFRVPYVCHSWRHEGECRLWRGACDFVRIKEGLEKRTNWIHMVLTFEGHGKVDPYHLFVAAKERWAKLRKRIQRQGRMYYVGVWEQHQDGYPHGHIALSSPDLDSQCWHRGPCRGRRNWVDLMQSDAVECGFGKIGWLDPLRSTSSMAGYLVKLARELTGSGIKSQVPINAPRHFRRLRASQRTLPPIRHNPDISGVLKMIELGSEVPDITCQ